MNIHGLWLISVLGWGCGGDTSFVNRTSDAPPELRVDLGGGTASSDANGIEASSARPGSPLVIERLFMAPTAAPRELQWDQVGQTLSELITMTAQPVTETLTQEQLRRPEVTDIFTQGHPGSAAQDAFVQRPGTGVLDIALVIDNSGSMREEQVNLASRLSPLLSYVANADWRIGVVTTDPSGGCLRRLIKKGDPDTQTAFSQAIQAGTSGTGNEQGIRMAVETLRGQCLSQPWMRPSSTVAVLIVTDEDNCSNGQGCTGQPWQSGNYLTDYLSSIRTLGQSARVYGILWHPSQSQSQCSTGYNMGNIYASVIAQSGGTWGSICDADYSQTLRRVSEDISVILDAQFVLRHIPDAGSLSVTVDGIAASNWTLTGPVLTFVTPPPQGAAILASYTHGQMPMKNSFVLSQDALRSGMRATVNGVDVGAEGFLFDDAANTVAFFTQPPARADIRVLYRKEIPLPVTFSVGTPALPAGTTATMNGVAILPDRMSLDHQAGQVTFTTPPPEGARLVFKVQRPATPIHVYPVALLGQAGSDVTTLTVADKISGQELPFSIDAATKTLTFTQGEFTLGRQVLVSLWVGNKLPSPLPLGEKHTDGTLVMQRGNVICHEPDRLTLVTAPQDSGTFGSIDWSSCPIAGESGQVTIGYTATATPQKTFPMSLAEELGENWLETLASNPQTRVDVLVGGEPTTQYRWLPDGIELAEPPPTGSSVSVRITLRE